MHTGYGTYAQAMAQAMAHMPHLFMAGYKQYKNLKPACEIGMGDQSLAACHQLLTLSIVEGCSIPGLRGNKAGGYQRSTIRQTEVEQGGGGDAVLLLHPGDGGDGVLRAHQQHPAPHMTLCDPSRLKFV